MRYIFTGSAAFSLFFLFDYYNFKNDAIKKTLFGILGTILFLYSIVMTAVNSKGIGINLPVRIMSVLLCTLFAFLLLYSLFLELPFSSTYAGETYNSSLVDTGTYALSRHPGVLWLFLFFISFFLATGLLQILTAGLIWTGCDAIYVYFQEKFFFIKMFPDYEKYKQSTPMLIPNMDSIRKSADTIFLKRG